MKKKVKEVKPKNERVVLRPVVNDATQYINSEDGVIYEKKVFYIFRSRIPGLFVYPGDDGQGKTIEGYSTRDDISPKERLDIMRSEAYRDGYVVEEGVEDIDNIQIPSAMNDVQMEKLCKEYLDNKKTKEEMIKYIVAMESVFSINLFKEKMEKTGLPGYMLKYCDSRIAELEEEAAKKAETSIE